MIVIAVDDESLALRMLERELNKIPDIEEVIPFSSSVEALNYAKKHKIEMAVLDVSMPEMDGLTLGEKLRELHPQMILIYATAYSEYAAGAFSIHAQAYLQKPITAQALEKELNYLRDPVRISGNKPRVFLHTFGNFDVFVDGHLLAFSKLKAKELLAYLVDRKGASATTSEIAGILWEDKPYSRSTKTQVVRVISELSEILENAGVPELLIKTWGAVALDINQVDCDFFRFINGDTSVLSSFQGEYMNNYSWAEETAAEIEFQIQKKGI